MLEPLHAETEQGLDGGNSSTYVRNSTGDKPSDGCAHDCVSWVGSVDNPGQEWHTCDGHRNNTTESLAKQLNTMKMILTRRLARKRS
jgi:hypothetical protein